MTHRSRLRDALDMSIIPETRPSQDALNVLRDAARRVLEPDIGAAINKLDNHHDCFECSGPSWEQLEEAIDAALGLSDD